MALPQYGGQYSMPQFAEQNDGNKNELIPMGLPLDGDTPDHIRQAFVRKVYSILFVQLAVTFVLGFFTNYVVKDNLVLAQPLMLFSMVITMGTMCGVMCCCQSAARVFPYNYIFLLILTVGMSILTGIATVAYTGPSVMIAVATTAVVFGCLTAYACFTKTDWTGCGPYLFAGLFAMIGFGIVMQLFCMFGMCPGEFTQKLFAGVGVVLFTMYIIYDTQLIIGGNHKNQYSIDDYVFAALNLYLDVINLFLYILQLTGQRD